MGGYFALPRFLESNYYLRMVTGKNCTLDKTNIIKKNRQSKGNLIEYKLIAVKERTLNHDD